MPDSEHSEFSDFQEFQRQLLNSGVAARHARRAVLELREHLQDLQEEAEIKGMSPTDAEQHARQMIGDMQSIARMITSRPELRSWPFRYPRFARVLLPAAYVILLPVTPLFIGVAKGPEIARWVFCMMIGALVTGGIFLVLQLSIAFNG